MKLETTLSTLTALMLATACGPGGGAPPTTGGGGGGGGGGTPTVTIPASTTALPDRLVDGPLPGCADAFELVGQTLTLPAMPLTFDAGGIIDRVGITATGATYTFALRPVNPIDCSSTTGARLPFPTVTFSFSYLGDFTRSDPMCLNGSRLTLTGFSVTGTPLDGLIAGVARDFIWMEIDRAVIARLDALLMNGNFTAGGNPRCTNWEEF